MIRLTRQVFADLAIWMVGFGLIMGIVFPFFTVVMGVPTAFVLTPWFFAACMSAGFVVGAVNIGLARVIVGRRLRVLADRMRFIETNLRQGVTRGSDPATCEIVIDSEDEIGESAQAFNHLVQALAASRQTDAAIRAFNEMLTSQLELDLLADQALLQLIQHTHAIAGVILVEAEGELQVAAAHAIRAPSTIACSDHIRRALRTEKRQVVVLPDDVAVEGVLTDFRPCEIIIEPVLYKRVPLGVVVLAGATAFPAQAHARLGLFNHGLALALNNALIHDRLQRLAALDPLTSTYNRRFGMARLHEEFGRAVRQTTPLGVLMFDIDHFKKTNDTYGHLIGDRVLLRIAQIARTVMREGDVVVRYGGEEFLAVLPAAAREDVRNVGERLRRMVEEASIVDGDQMIRVTISVGGTAYPELNVESEEELVKYADQALYSAKSGGRNRVIVA